jgi:hypothetical protein
METIDATAVDTSFMGHAYFAEERTLLSDLFYLVRDGSPADKRFSLIGADCPSGHYWKFKP